MSQHPTPDEPQSVEALFERGKALMARQQFADAAEAYRDASRLRPENAYAHYNLACAELKLRHLEDAVTEFRHAAGIDPTLAPSA